jgi:hypothetical protein
LEEFAMFVIRLHIRGLPAPVELPGWPDVFTAVVVRDILRSSPLIQEAEVVEVDACATCSPTWRKPMAATSNVEDLEAEQPPPFRRSLPRFDDGVSSRFLPFQTRGLSWLRRGVAR